MAEILVSEGIQAAALDALRRDFDVVQDADLWQSPQQLKAAIAGARALVVRNRTQVDKPLLAAAPRLEIVCRAGVGLDNIDVEAASAAGIVVSYAPRANSVSVAELTFGLMLALARHIPAAHADTRGGGWHRQQFTGRELAGKTLGVVGLGRIGALVASRARAFEMAIVAHDEFLADDDPRLGPLAARLLPLEEMLAASDVVSCHVPLTDRTRDMFSYERFCRMKPGALFVNTSRGEVVDEAGLERALREGHLAGAALDVRRTEPPARGALESLDNVILTPHVAAFTCEAQERVLETICGDIRAVLAGQPAASFANFPRPQRS